MPLKRKMLPLNALRTFEAVGRHGSIVLAADELGVTHGAVSQLVKKLEDQLNCALVDRTHKPYHLTENGKQLLVTVTQALDLLARKTGEISSGKVEGELTVSCVPGLGANWLAPLIGEFLELHDGVRINLTTDIWHNSERFEDADLGIVFDDAERPGKRVTRLGHPDYFPVCSPELSHDGQFSRTVSNMLKFNLLHEHVVSTWARWFAGVGIPDAIPKRNIVFDGAHLALQAARAGHGIALGDIATVAGDLKNGTLVQLSDTTIPAIHPYYIVTPTIDKIKPAALTLEAWLIEKYRATCAFEQD